MGPKTKATKVNDEDELRNIFPRSLRDLPNHLDLLLNNVVKVSLEHRGVTLRKLKGLSLIKILNNILSNTDWL